MNTICAAAFDFDGTLVQSAQIIELAKKAGKLPDVVDLGRAGFKDMTQARALHKKAVELLRGLPYDEARDVGNSLDLMPGAEEMMKVLKSRNILTAIITNGYTVTAQPVQEKLGVDRLCANDLLFEEGFATGEMLEYVVDDQAKAIAIRELAESWGIDIRQVVAVGDAINDLPMLKEAGVSIAFNADELLRPLVDVYIAGTDLCEVAEAILLLQQP